MDQVSYDYDSYVGLKAEPIVSAPLEFDTVRRFAQAIMDNDPSYYDAPFAAGQKEGHVTAPPLYPIHALRRPAGTPDPLEPLTKDPTLDGTGDLGSFLYGLPPIPMPFKRLLNGGSDIEFCRCLAIGERAVATASYKSIALRKGKSGDMLIVVIETNFKNDRGDDLVTVRQTAIWR